MTGLARELVLARPQGKVVNATPEPQGESEVDTKKPAEPKARTGRDRGQYLLGAAGVSLTGSPERPHAKARGFSHFFKIFTNYHETCGLRLSVLLALHLQPRRIASRDRRCLYFQCHDDRYRPELTCLWLRHHLPNRHNHNSHV